MRRHADEASNVAEKLLKACTWNAARMIDNADLGNIAVGGFADLFILKGGKAVNGSQETALNTFTETGDSGVEAVIVGGRIVYADKDFLKSEKDSFMIVMIVTGLSSLFCTFEAADALSPVPASPPPYCFSSLAIASGEYPAGCSTLLSRIVRMKFTIKPFR